MCERGGERHRDGKQSEGVAGSRSFAGRVDGARVAARQRLACEKVFVGEDAVECGTADGELARGTKLVAVIEVEDVLDVMVYDGV